MPLITDINLSKYIAIRRRELGMTQAQLAEKQGIESETLSRFERGKHLPSLVMLEKIALILLIPISDLLAEETKKAEDDALIISSWLSGLTISDRAFVHNILKQCCDHLIQKNSQSYSDKN